MHFRTRKHVIPNYLLGNEAHNFCFVERKYLSKHTLSNNWDFHFRSIGSNMSSTDRILAVTNREDFLKKNQKPKTKTKNRNQNQNQNQNHTILPFILQDEFLQKSLTSPLS